LLKLKNGCNPVSFFSGGLRMVDVSSVRLDHLGLPATLAEEIGLVDALDELVPLDPRATLSFGQTVLAMILNSMGFTSKPLYMSPDFFKRRDLKFLLGGSKTQKDLELNASHLNEHKLGRTLDRIASIGPDRVFLTAAVKAFRALGVKVPQIHLDTTSHSFYGEYAEPNGDSKTASFPKLEDPDDIVEVILTHGYSKDFKVNCKQVVQ
jgi:transposase